MPKKKRPRRRRRRRRRRRTAQKGGVAPLTAAKLAESGPKIDSQYKARLQVVLGWKHGQKCVWPRPRDPVEKVLDTPQKRYADAYGQGSRRQIPQRLCGPLKSIKREGLDPFPPMKEKVTFCQHARRQFVAISTRRIPSWQWDPRGHRSWRFPRG